MSLDSFGHRCDRYRRDLLEAVGMGRDFVSATGDFLYDAGGRRYYDASAQYGTNIFGHNDAQGVETLKAYLDQSRPNFVQPFCLDVRDRLAALLISQTRAMHYCVFANSGAEAVEAALKLARLSSRRRRIVSLKNGFHGKTQLALSVSGSDRFSDPLICQRDVCDTIVPGDLETLARLLDGGDVAAFLFEPVMGEGGMSVIDREFLAGAIALCREANVVVIADEIQCGMYRCGGLLASDVLGLDIDVALLGKGLGGGLMPVSAVLYRSRVRSLHFDRKHSSTFAGGGLACAVALGVVERIVETPGIAENVTRLSARVDYHAERLAGRVSVTGMGLMRGLYFHGMAAEGSCGLTFLRNSHLLAYLISSYLFNRHAIIALPLLSQDCAIRFEPALNTRIGLIDEFFEAVADVAQLIGNGRFDLLFAAILGRSEQGLPDRSIAIPPYNDDDLRCLRVVSSDIDGEGFDFAFLSHLTCPADVVQLLPRAVRENLPETDIGQIVEIVSAIGRIDPSPAPLLAFEIAGARATRRGVILSSLIYPREMMRLSRRDKEDLVDAYFTLARGYGARVIGLGAFTSIITGGGVDAAQRFPDLCLTTGNTLTAAATCSLLESASGGWIDRTVVVGARGSIGSLVTLAAARISSELVLIGRRAASIFSYRDLLTLLCREMLKVEAPRPGTVAARIQQLLPDCASDIEIGRALPQIASNSFDGAMIVVTDEHERALRGADAVVSCTSEGKSFLSRDLLRHDAIVLDAARPFDFRPDQGSGPAVIEAGLVRQPAPRRYGDNNMLVAETGMALGCLSETVILSMEGVRESFMIGADASLEALRLIEHLATRHGFALPETAAPARTEPSRRSRHGRQPVRPRQLDAVR